MKPFKVQATAIKKGNKGKYTVTFATLAKDADQAMNQATATFDLSGVDQLTLQASEISTSVPVVMGIVVH